MRALVVSIWVFINLVFFGMCGYMYLLWSQYWMYMERQTEATTSIYDQQIYFYNRGYYPSDAIVNKSINSKPLPETKLRKKHSIYKENSTVTLIKNSKPRYATRVSMWNANWLTLFLGSRIYSLEISNLILKNIIALKVMTKSTVIRKLHFLKMSY